MLKLAKTLREKNKMIYFRPLCFTEYVMVTLRGNSAGIKSLEDLTRPGVRVILPGINDDHVRAIAATVTG